MKLDTAGFTDKDSHKPEYRELYETLPFIEAYAKHTDMRIAKDGPELAIGAKRDGQQDWDKHGKMQLDFLIAKGLKPEHCLLDFGCGTGRLAVKAVPYLDRLKYVGCDISPEAIKHAGQACGSIDKAPAFITSGSGTMPVNKLWHFDFIWAHSVLTHLPPDCVCQLFKTLAEMSFGRFYFTYKPSDIPQRSGLKQFQYPADFFGVAAHSAGLEAAIDPMTWPAGQRTMRVWRA